ncbi:MAG: choice-of-anchor I family protein [Pseudomonadota bacterium]
MNIFSTRLAKAMTVGGFLALAVACTDEAPEIRIPIPPPDPVFMTTNVSLTAIGGFETGIFDNGAAEIVAFDPTTNQMFIVNSANATVDVVDISQPGLLISNGTINVAALGGSANSAAVSGSTLAVAIEASNPQDPGLVALYSTIAPFDLITTVTVGALPDMVTFTTDGETLLVANEGEPNDAYTVDPEGSVSIIDVSMAIAAVDDAAISDDMIIRTAGFGQYAFPDTDGGVPDGMTALPDGVRIFGPGASIAQDLEPEFIAAVGSTTAYVALQENNAIGVLDINTATFTNILPLGTKDHSAEGNGFDASDRDMAIDNGDVMDGINIALQPTMGLYQPDGIAVYAVNGQLFIVTANEGDTRDYAGFSEEARVGNLSLDPAAFPSAADLQMEQNLGRLQVTTVDGDSDGDGDVDTLFSIGGRSFSIFDTGGNLIFDSGDDFEQILATEFPADFNSDNDENSSFDSRSDNKGPEPEGVALLQIDQQIFAFIGLERMGGVMIYDVSNPAAPIFQNYVNTRNFAATVQNPDGTTNTSVGDLGPEGIVAIPAASSPTGAPILLVANEVSGTTRIFQVSFDTVEVTQDG